MYTLSRITFLPASSDYNLHLPTTYAFSPFPRAFSSEINTALVKVSRAGPLSPSVSDADEDVLQIFLKERELNGDFISRACDILWLRKFTSSVDSDISNLTNNTLEQTQQMLQDTSARRKKLNILKYESLKREILLVSVGIGLACSGYCLITLSIQAAISYAIGVRFSCLYLQLLYQHADNLSSETVPQIFRKKKPKKIGISEALQDLLVRSIMGCSMSLSSPRLVIPPTIFGLWETFGSMCTKIIWLEPHLLSYNENNLSFMSMFLSRQLVPAMLGMFVYKAAVLVQVYRDNEEFKLMSPENGDGSSD